MGKHSAENNQRSHFHRQLFSSSHRLNHQIGTLFVFVRQNAVCEDQKKSGKGEGKKKLGVLYPECGSQYDTMGKEGGNTAYNSTGKNTQQNPF